jgi:hypothetical protein
MTQRKEFKERFDVAGHILQTPQSQKRSRTGLNPVGLGGRYQPIRPPNKIQKEDN